MFTPAQVNEKLVSVGGQFTSTVAVAAANTVIKAAPGRVCRIVITTAGTTAFQIFDNATTNSGTILYQSPAANSVGTVIDVQMPAQNGITVANTATGPAFTISWE